MSIAQSFLPEFDHEFANARKMIELIPEDKFEWKPHQKSFTLCQLTSHVINVASWTKPTLEFPELDMNPVGGEPFTTPQISSKKEALEMFDKNVAEARASIEKTEDSTWSENWRLLSAGQEFMSMPKIAVFRSFIMNHLIHHRAQLGVYLRILDVKIPGMYGPSADDEM